VRIVPVDPTLQLCYDNIAGIPECFGEICKTTMFQSQNEILSQAKQLLRAGRKEEARMLLAKFLQQNPQSEYGWWLMSFAVAVPGQQIDCLERVLTLNPNRRKAQARLQELTGSSPLADRETSRLRDDIRRNTSINLHSGRWIAIISVFMIVVISLIGFFGYRIYSEFQAMPLDQAMAVDQAKAVENSPTRQNVGLPPTWTQTPTEQLPLTQTPLPAPIETPIPTQTPTLDPNATLTPLPESLIGIEAGDFPPDFSLTNVKTGEVASIRNYAGQPVLIVFLTTWCGYCEAQMPLMQSIYDYYRHQGFVVLGIGVGESSAAMRNYGTKNGLTFPLLADTSTRVSMDYAIRAYPTNFYIDIDGTIGFVEVGMIPKAKLNFFILESQN